MLLKSRYRERFGLTAFQMAVEPADEVLLQSAIWDLDAKRQKREERQQMQAMNHQA